MILMGEKKTMDVKNIHCSSRDVKKITAVQRNGSRVAKVGGREKSGASLRWFKQVLIYIRFSKRFIYVMLK